MSIDKTSPEFEAWFKERFWHECYEDVKHHLFAAWQASRESLVIELPKIIDKEWASTLAECSAMRDAIGMCKKRIEAAGLKVKP